MAHCIYLGVTGYNFQKKNVLISLKIDFLLANSTNPDVMLHNTAFYLGLHCLPPECLFRGFLSPNTRVKIKKNDR